jgi:two-component system response regulator DegU
MSKISSVKVNPYEVKSPLFQCTIIGKAGIPPVRMTTLSKIKIVVADDHEEMLSLFKEILEPEFEVVATVCNGRDLLKAIKNLKLDVVIVDINMPEMNGFEVTRKIVESDPKARIILLSAHKDREMVEEGLSIGAKGFVLKLTAHEDLVRAVYAINQGQSYISPSLYR